MFFPLNPENNKSISYIFSGMILFCPLTTRRAHLRSIPGGTEAIWRSGAGKWGLLLGVAMVVAGIV